MFKKFREVNKKSESEVSLEKKVREAFGWPIEELVFLDMAELSNNEMPEFVEWYNGLDFTEEGESIFDDIEMHLIEGTDKKEYIECYGSNKIKSKLFTTV